jgi:hypothetical protein
MPKIHWDPNEDDELDALPREERIPRRRKEDKDTGKPMKPKHYDSEAAKRKEYRNDPDD